MGWKYEVETWMYERGEWATGYMGDSLIAAIRSILEVRRREPGRAYRLVIR